jgi:hypothetical protein
MGTQHELETLRMYTKMSKTLGSNIPMDTYEDSNITVL